MTDLTKERKSLKFKKIFIVFSIILILGIVVYFINELFIKNYDNFRLITSYEREDNDTILYKNYNGKLLKYSKDGASIIDSNNQEIGNKSYDMKNPVVSICGEYALIADIGGKEIVVFNGKDSGEMKETLLPIVQADIAQQGVVAIVMEDENSNIINIINPYDTTASTTPIVEFKTYISQDGYPIDIAISDDGKKLVTAYMDVSSGVIQNKLTFYNFGDIGKNKDTQVGMRNLENSLVADIEFINNNVICAYTDNGFTLFFMKQIPDNETITKTFDVTIKSTFFNEKYIGFVLENYDGEEKYHIVVYNLNGKEVVDCKVDYNYETVSIYKKEIIFYSQLECNILRFNGKEKFHYTFDKNISYFIPKNKYNEYFIIDNTMIREIKLSGGKSF